MAMARRPATRGSRTVVALVLTSTALAAGGLLLLLLRADLAQCTPGRCKRRPDGFEISATREEGGASRQCTLAGTYSSAEACAARLASLPTALRCEERRESGECFPREASGLQWVAAWAALLGSVALSCVGLLVAVRQRAAQGISQGAADDESAVALRTLRSFCSCGSTERILSSPG
ncbi:hypothetical protein AB1Y20_021862 [Prymnesium parvum]|uniref:Transmembrane protein 66 n=1 Tax=Prymnesium parvum TaxID=97485 RepID=A0AB34JJJ2_PRYPA